MNPRRACTLNGFRDTVYWLAYAVCGPARQYVRQPREMYGLDPSVAFDWGPPLGQFEDRHERHDHGHGRSIHQAPDPGTR